MRSKFKWQHTWPEMKAYAAPDPSPYANPDPLSPWELFSWNMSMEEFDILDRLLAKWNDPRERDQNGEWKLNAFRTVYLNYSPTTRDWKDMLQRIQRWRASNPRSAGAAIAEAKYWAEYARHIRGRGASKETDPVALKVFGERMQRAEQALKDSRSYASVNPLWYEAYLDVAVSTQRDDRFIQQLFEEGVRKFPNFQPLYLNMAKRWTPVSTAKPDWNKVDEIISHAAASMANLDGSADYATLYLQLNELQECTCELFKDSHVSWVRMRDSFEDLVKRYPSVENLNEYAALACRAGDKDTFLKVRPRIVGRILPDKWLSGYSYDSCDHKFMQGT